MTQVKAAVVKPDEKSALAGPPEQEEPAVRQPDGQEPERRAPTGDSPDRISFTDRRPGTTSREIVEEYIYVRMQTSMGDIILELDRGRAPITVDNFLTYVETGFYHGTIFHRVMSNFAIQGGAYDEDWEEKQAGPPIKSEWPNGLSNRRGAIAMARRNLPDTATSQFFINVRNNPVLDNPPGQAGYTVFGKVIEGMDVVDAIKDTPVQRSRLNQRERAEPVELIVIEEIEVIPPEAARSEGQVVETAGEAVDE
jgi:cyclophilin family peptidyl-prolyl cis-trans isomerase